MSIPDVITRARKEPAYKAPNLELFGAYVCTVGEPVVWSRADVERELSLTMPGELVTLWQECGGMTLYEETEYRQGGLVIFSPVEVIPKNQEYRRERAEDYRPGDLIFARFWGDGRLALVRSDRHAGDYGSIMIVAEIAERANWYTPARSLEEFLVRYMDTHGDDYWDIHYEQILANRISARK